MLNIYFDLLYLPSQLAHPTTLFTICIYHLRWHVPQPLYISGCATLNAKYKRSKADGRLSVTQYHTHISLQDYQTHEIDHEREYFFLFFMSFCQIERDTYGMLQCHPYPNEYGDSSKPCPHCAFFMGLQRKQGVKVQEGQQFDIRATVEEFKQDVNMYMFWKPGMDIHVSHVRRKQIPAYVFPDGYKRSRPSRHTNQQAERTSEEDAEGCRSQSAEKQLKRKKDSELVDAEKDIPAKRVSISPQRVGSVSPASVISSSGGASQARCSVEVKLEPSPKIKMDYNEAGCTRRVLNLEEGPVDGVGEPMKPCKQLAQGENDNSALASNFSIQSLNGEVSSFISGFWVCRWL